MTENTDFEYSADEYDHLLNEGLSVTGEDKLYFARQRLVWLRHVLRTLQMQPDFIIDFGCGTGTAIPLIFEILNPTRVAGIDISKRSLAEARKVVGLRQVEFASPEGFDHVGTADLVFCNGVFHHIPPQERWRALGQIFRFLRPGGLFALWENNPWNPGTVYIMNRSVLDRNAITLSPVEARRNLSDAGYLILRTDFLFIFPRILAWLRRLEPHLSRLPLGGQYQILARKPLRQM